MVVARGWGKGGTEEFELNGCGVSIWEDEESSAMDGGDVYAAM